MKNNIPSEKIVPFIEDKLHLKFESLIDKKGILVRRQGEGMVLDSTDEMSVIVKLSDMTTDRSGEVLVPEGCNYDEYMNNPVVCWSHDYSVIPLAKITEIQVTDKSIFAKIKFGTTEKCKEIYTLVKDGILSATSVGFVATEEIVKGTRQFAQYIKDNASRLSDVDNINKIITKWTLLEDSFVSIPCNPNALVVAKTYASEDMMIKLSKVNKIDIKEIMQKEDEIKPEDIEDAGSTQEEAFSKTEVTPVNEVMPSQEVPEEAIKEVEQVEEDKPITHAETCECKECSAKKGCAKKEEEVVESEEVVEETKSIEVVENVVEVKVESQTIEAVNTEVTEVIKTTGDSVEDIKVEVVVPVEPIVERFWKVISEPIDLLVVKEMDMIEKKKKGKIK